MKTKRRRTDQALCTRSITLRADTVDAEGRRVEAVIASDARVLVYDPARFEIIEEILLPSGAELPQQVPLLDSHGRSSTRDMLGSVRDLSATQSVVVGWLYFAGDAESERVWGLVRDGHLTDISAGYVVLRKTIIPAGKSATVGGRSFTAGDRPLHIATKWRLREASVLPIGADERAKVRGGEAIGSLSKTRRKKLRDMLARVGVRRDLDCESLWETVDLLSDSLRAEALGIIFGRAPAHLAAADASSEPAASAETATGTPPAAPLSTRSAAAELAPVPSAAADVGPVQAQRIEYAREDAAKAERERIRSIMAIADGVPAHLVDQAIREAWDVDRAADEFDNWRSAEPAPRQPVTSGPFDPSRWWA